MRTLFLVLGTLILTLSLPLLAQEQAVAVDTDQKIERIDPDLESRLGLFPDLAGFQEARIFQIDDSTFALETYYRPSGVLLKRRTVLSRTAMEAFRQRVSEAIATKAASITINQEGRAWLLTGSTAIALGYYGTAITVAADLDDSRAIVGAYMLSGAAGFFIPYLATSNVPVRNADADLSLFGAALGAGHGVLLALLIHGPDETSATTFGYSIPISIAEGIAGFMISDRNQLSQGKVGVISGVGALGAGIGIGTAYLADLFDSGGERGSAAIMLAGSAAGLVVGNTMANMQSYTVGNARVLSAAAALGAFVPLAIVDLAGGGEEGKPYVAASIGGSIGGLLAGHFLVKEKDFTASQGAFIALSEFAGGLLGFGISYLASSRDGDNSSLYLSAGAAGAVGGFALMYGLMADQPRQESEGSLLNLNISPTGIAALLGIGQRPTGARNVAPLANLSYRF